MFIPEGGRKYAHTNSYNSAMTVIAQDDHVTAGAWAAYGQSSCEVSASLTDVGGVAVGATDLIYCPLSVPRFVFVFDVSQ